MNPRAVFIYGFAKGANLPLTMKAVNLAHILHKGQERDDGTDYVEHVVDTCHILISHRITKDEVLAAAILHDVVEDGKYTLEEIAKNFNDRVANLVRKLTKTKNMGPEEYYRVIGDDIDALAIKAADRTHNVSDMIKVFSLERLKKYVEETEKYVLPQMKIARKMNIEYGDLFVALALHINSVLLPIKMIIEIKEAEQAKA
ncbi:hypothetical protein C0584_05010 [Candidatus Parcubacteria bacterium]|nr:MAG: hypothetical protein C0584_05010 [Candidatus Parcubacteria bacterium]